MIKDLCWATEVLIGQVQLLKIRFYGNQLKQYNWALSALLNIYTSWCKYLFTYHLFAIFYHVCFLKSCSDSVRSFLAMLKLKAKLILVDWQKAKIFLFKFMWHCVFLTMFIFLISNGKWYCSHPFKGRFLIFFFFFYSWFILFSHVVFIRAIPSFVDFHFTYRVLKLSHFCNWLAISAQLCLTSFLLLYIKYMLVLKYQKMWVSWLMTPPLWEE